MIGAAPALKLEIIQIMDVKPRYQSKYTDLQYPNGDLFDLYAKPDDGWLSDEQREEERLKHLLEADALRFYGYVRKYVSMTVRAIREHTQELLQKIGQRKKFLIATVITIFIGVGGWQWNAQRTIPQAVLSDSARVLTDQTVPEGVSSRIDSLLNMPVTLTTQPVPADVRNNPLKLTELASRINTGSMLEIPVDWGFVYLVKESSGITTAVYTFGDTLNFARSYSQEPSEVWIEYIKSTLLLKYSN